jgi:hypothetical protein
VISIGSIVGFVTVFGIARATSFSWCTITSIEIRKRAVRQDW